MPLKMPVVIVQDGSKEYLKELGGHLSGNFAITFLNGCFVAIRNSLINMDPNTVYIVENSNEKPHVYEIYYLARKNGTSCCVLTDGDTLEPRNGMFIFDTKNGIQVEKILECLKLKFCRGDAHKKRITGSNYLMNVKQVINRINKGMPKGSDMILKNCENMIMRALQQNYIELENVENVYNEIILKELKSKGLAE